MKLFVNIFLIVTVGWVLLASVAILLSLAQWSWVPAVATLIYHQFSAPVSFSVGLILPTLLCGLIQMKRINHALAKI